MKRITKTKQETKQAEIKKQRLAHGPGTCDYLWLDVRAVAQYANTFVSHCSHANLFGLTSGPHTTSNSKHTHTLLLLTCPHSALLSCHGSPTTFCTFCGLARFEFAVCLTTVIITFQLIELIRGN